MASSRYTLRSQLMTGLIAVGRVNVETREYAMVPRSNWESQTRRQRVTEGELTSKLLGSAEEGNLMLNSKVYRPGVSRPSPHTTFSSSKSSACPLP